MATVSYTLKGSTNKKNVYVSLSLQRGKRYLVNTQYVTTTNDWNDKTKNVKQNNPTNKQLHSKLYDLQHFIYEQLNVTNKEITKDWLINTINIYRGSSIKENNNTLLYYLNEYLNYLKTSKNKYGNVYNQNVWGKVPVIIKKIKEIEKKLKKTIYIHDVNVHFGNIFKQHYTEQNYSQNYLTQHLKTIKTVCNFAENQGATISNQLKHITLQHEKSINTYLSFDELKQIELTTYTNENINVAKQWLLIGCYIGQRVSDLLTLTSDNIVTINGIKVIQLKQNKTQKQINIPLHPIVERILGENNYQFPEKLTIQKFNYFIKVICKQAGITQRIKGSKVNPTTNRKENGTYEKWELISSHVCRRSFCTNFYSIMNTSLILQVSGHSTENQLLTYIKKANTEYVQQIAECFNSIM